MRFKDFLTENEDEEYDYSDPDYVELMSAVGKCEHNLRTIASGQQLPAWRGDDATPPQIRLPSRLVVGFLERSPRTDRRESKAGANMAMTYTEHAWKGLPKRSFSNFGTMNFGFAEEVFDTACWIIPFDNVKQYATSPNDFNIFDDHSNVADCHTLLNDVLRACRQIQRMTAQGYRDDYASFETADKVIALAKKFGLDAKSLALGALDVNGQPKILQFIDSLLLQFPFKKAREIDYFAETFNDTLLDIQIVVGKEGIVKYLENHFSPKAFDITVVNSYKGLPKHTKTKSEFWFDGGYLMFDGFHNKSMDSATKAAISLAQYLLELLDRKS